MPETDLTNTIAEAAAAPSEMQTDAGRASSHPIPDLIAADKYLKGKNAASQPHRGIRFTKLVPPGAV